MRGVAALDDAVYGPVAPHGCPVSVLPRFPADNLVPELPGADLPGFAVLVLGTIRLEWLSEGPHNPVNSDAKSGRTHISFGRIAPDVHSKCFLVEVHQLLGAELFQA